MSSVQDVRDGVCRWFGGSYDKASRTYRQPQISGLGAVRRGRSKISDDSEYFLGSPSSGAPMGAVMLVHVDAGEESRAAMAGPYGLKLLESAVILHCLLRSHAEWAEDATDAFYDFLEAIKDRLREDPDLGSGGFERGGFNVGEGGTPWLRWQMAPPETSAEMTSAYLSIEFRARYYETG